MRCRAIWCMTGLLLCGIAPLKAQSLDFDQLTVEDGLPSNMGVRVLQDQRGYLWIATYGGLSRYDGYEVTTYVHTEGDSTSLSSNLILWLEEGRDGTLWIGTNNGGLNRFDQDTETFRSYQHIEGDSTSMPGHSVFVVQEARDGTLWVGTDKGLSLFDPEEETFRPFRPARGDTTLSGYGGSVMLHEARDGTLWIGAGRSGNLYRFDPETETLHALRPTEAEPPQAGSTRLNETAAVQSIHEARDGTIWFGAWDGVLYRFDPQAETLRIYDPFADDAERQQGNGVFTIEETRDGMLWMGTWLGGLVRFDPETETFHTFRHDPSDPASLSHDRVIDIEEARDGTIWLATFGGGVNRFDPASRTFHVYRHAEGDPTSLSQDWINAVHEARDGTLWLGAYDGGLIHFDPQAETFHTYPHDPDDSTSLSNDDVSAIQEARDGTLWVGTDLDGLNRFDPQTGTFRVYRHTEGDPTSLSHNSISTLLGATDGTLWIGTWGGGLNRFNPQTETFHIFRHDPNDPASLADDRIQAMIEADDGTLWIATQGGLSWLDPQTETFHTFRHDPDDPASLIHDAVTSLHLADDGTLWIGTAQGMSRLEGFRATDPGAATFTHVARQVDVRSIAEDDAGRLWAGQRDGRMVSLDLETGTPRYFGQRHGLPLGAFTSGIKSRTGTLYWGNVSGLVALRPEDVPPPSEPPQLHLRELRIFDEPLTPTADGPLQQPLSETERVVLAHDQNDLTFRFVGLHYGRPEGNDYRYRLLGYNENWRGSTTQRQATYTNLPPGSYTFEVRAANSDGVWTEEPVRLGVVIRPPWWKTWWAYAGYGLLFLGGFFAADRWQRRRLIAQERERAREKELAQAREIEKAHGELQQAHTHLKATQAQLVQQEKMASLGQLTAGIAHEIKNPLNFITNFSEITGELVEELNAEIEANPDKSIADLARDFKEILADLGTNAEQIHKHGRRADGIVQAMMQHASGGSGQREPTDVSALVSEYIDLAYHGKRAQVPDFTCEIERDLAADVGQVEMVPQEIGRVLLNLLGNAFDAVHDVTSHGRATPPTVTVTTRRDGDTVEIRVSDNGVGIPHDVRERIFEPFFTTKPTGSGTGLGLSLSYDIVTQGHGGTLTVESEEGQGATFVVTLPCA